MPLLESSYLAMRGYLANTSGSIGNTIFTDTFSSDWMKTEWWPLYEAKLETI